jgi:prepilin-type processing-associated H-X9-DG protein
VLEILIAMMIVIIVVGVLFAPMLSSGTYRTSRKAADAQNARQVALAALMYAGDNDNRMVPTVNGWLSRLQNRSDKQKTIDCPGPGTQDLPATDAAGAERTDTWVALLMPYIRSRLIYVDPGRGDLHGYFPVAEPLSVGDKGYDPEGNTYRNRERFPMYGVNYMFLSPLRIPKDKRGRPNAINYAVAEVVDLSKAADPSGTVFYVDSQRSQADQTRGFFVVNAPGMWPAFADNKNGYVAFWSGTKGSGDWVGTVTACNDFSEPCEKPTISTNFVCVRNNGGANTTFVDGHVKYMKAEALAAGTNYLAAVAGSAGSPGSGAIITDKKHYLWNFDDNYYGQ